MRAPLPSSPSPLPQSHVSAAPSPPISPVITVALPTWKSLSRDIHTNIVKRQLLYEKFTTNAVAACGIRYFFRKGSYLNFINLDRNEQSGYNAYMEDFDGAYNALEFGGPETLKVLLKRRVQETRNALEIENH